MIGPSELPRLKWAHVAGALILGYLAVLWCGGWMVFHAADPAYKLGALIVMAVLTLGVSITAGCTYTDVKRVETGLV